MSKHKFYLAIIALFHVSTPALSQEHNASDSHDMHQTEDIEFGASLGYAYLKEEQKNGINIHLHAMKRLSDEGLLQHVSVGLGVETILTDEAHYAAMLSVAVHPWKSLILSVSPGYEWANHDGTWESSYATHLEATYTFESSNFHYGPVFGYSKTADTQHYTAGIHFGMHFD